ncbi:MAG: glycosyltransferase family 4 protein [Deltaproteobacteria bacterium]|nr:glycosyltransferase family 4 protein [Deltaproteobacteria bacterium]
MVDEIKSNSRLTSSSFGRCLRGWYYCRVMRLFTLLQNIALAIAKTFGRRLRQPHNGEGYRILLTGSFDSSNWILSYLRPLAASKACSHITMVSSSPVPAFPKVDAVYPPKWLVRVIGATPARLLIFFSTAVRKHPNIVGGYSILANGLVASVVAPIVGARSLYHCVGGPAEVLDGGVYAEDGPFTKIEIPDLVVERRLLRAVAACDIVLTMGTKAVDFFQSRGVNTDFHVISASIDIEQFAPADSPPCYDLIFVGRLVEIKCIDILLKAVQHVRNTIPNVTAVIVGEGPLRGELEQLVRELGISDCVAFVGRQHNIREWLNKARLFVLTSRSEGLSIAMTEAMACGLPAVVSDVGDLADLVEDGINGFLVPRLTPELFADRIIELLTNNEKLRDFSQAARRSALRYDIKAMAQRWDNIIASCRES